jgi:tetratricopeptide (TPR) repeat protein
MITESDVIAPCEGPAAPADSESAVGRTPRIPPTPRNRLATVKRLLAVGLVAGLVGFNLWWYWRDTRPVEGLGAIEEMIGRQQYVQAEAALRERLRLSPHESETRVTLGRVLAARGDLLACARELDRVPYWSPRKAEAQFREAQAFLMADRARDAEAVLLALLDGDPLHPPDPGLYHDASQELLKIYATENRWEDFYSVIWKAHDHAAPQDRPRMLAMRIRCELDRVAPAESIKVLRRYVAADAADFEALRALANAELAVGQKAEAVRDMEACLRSRPEDSRAWRDYLTMLQSLGEVDVFNAALARVPAAAEVEPEIWMFRGQAREREGDWPGAAEHLRRALELNPNLPTASGGRSCSTRARTCARPMRSTRPPWPPPPGPGPPAPRPCGPRSSVWHPSAIRWVGPVPPRAGTGSRRRCERRVPGDRKIKEQPNRILPDQ